MANTVDKDKLVKHLIEELLKEPAVASAFNDLQRSVSSLLPEIVKKVTDKFITEIVITQAKNIQNPLVSCFLAKEKTDKLRKPSKDWSKISDNSIRSAYSYRKRKKIDIEDILNEELAKRFPNYDKVTKEFFKRADKKTRQDWSNASKGNLYSSYHYRKRLGLPIEDNLNEVLAKTFPLYDKETKSFNRKKRDSKLVKLKK